MGQYWKMRNLDKGQELGTHALGEGLKYVEQWFSGSMYAAMMLLLTDKSSLSTCGSSVYADAWGSYVGPGAV